MMSSREVIMACANDLQRRLLGASDSEGSTLQSIDEPVRGAVGETRFQRVPGGKVAHYWEASILQVDHQLKNSTKARRKSNLLTVPNTLPFYGPGEIWITRPLSAARY